MTSLFKKLNFKEETEVIILNAPTSFNPEIEAISTSTKVVEKMPSKGKISFALVFVRQQKDIAATMSTVYPLLHGDAKLWMAYPKKSSKNYKTDISRDDGWAVMGQFNVEGVRQIAIDEDWSALRFRKVEYIKTMKRKPSMALSKKGKSKINQSKDGKK